MKPSISRAEARRIALAAQGFALPHPQNVTARNLHATFGRMATVQIDSVNVFARSHYMPFFSRLGEYEFSTLDEHLFRSSGRYTEYWAHVASFIPMADWGLFDFRMRELRAKYGAVDGWFHAHSATVDWVRRELRDRGPLRPAEIEHDSRTAPRGPWWDWDAVKRSLEYLWLFGEVAIAGRRGFERTYALAEDVIPPSVMAAPVPRSDAIRELVRRAARAYGVATAADLADYWRIRDRRTVLAAIADLVDAGELQPVCVDEWSKNGRSVPTWVHKDARLPRRLDAAALLTPFDPVVWFRDRAERLFDFEYRIEIYTPAPARVYGYYSLPVIIGDDVVARVDLKADRATSTLLVQSAWWEAAVPEDAAARLAGEIRRAARWQGLANISVSRWGDATGPLAAELVNAQRHGSTPSSAPTAISLEG